MLMMYLFFCLTAWVLYELVSRILHRLYLIRISMLVDSIGHMEDLLFLSLQDFEYVIAEIFRRSGYKVKMSRHFADGGNGIILDDMHYVVARKDAFHHLIEIEQARKLVKHMQDNQIYRGMIITLGDFKQNTRNYCHMYVITCICGNQLMQMLKKAQSLKPVIIKLP